jgi:hypothetical protein
LNKKIWNNKFSPFFGLLLLVLFSVTVNLCNENRIAPGDVREQALKAEFNLIQPLPGALRTNLTARSKGGKQAIVSARFKTNKSYDEIRTFYFDEALKNGWTFSKEATKTDWGSDLGGKTIDFYKDEYELSIQYAGEKADYGWDFAVSLSCS